MAEELDRLRHDLDTMFLEQIEKVGRGDTRSNAPATAGNPQLTAEQLSTQRRALKKQCAAFLTRVKRILQLQPRESSEDVTMAASLEELRDCLQTMNESVSPADPAYRFTPLHLEQKHFELQMLSFLAPTDGTPLRNRIARYYGS